MAFQAGFSFLAYSSELIKKMDNLKRFIHNLMDTCNYDFVFYDIANQDFKDFGYSDDYVEYTKQRMEEAGVGVVWSKTWRYSIDKTLISKRDGKYKVLLDIFEEREYTYDELMELGGKSAIKLEGVAAIQMKDFDFEDAYKQERDGGDGTAVCYLNNVLVSSEFFLENTEADEWVFFIYYLNW